ncbi:hypothetical protein B0O99DRAFT_748622 [Bisporella sp. PMI_857]|nr:hypothetical protein B0O99DRAFT_748622 [Bisporella sp. PMI_857]
MRWPVSTMRLLECCDNGEFSLTKELDDDIPRYAILSHTWEAEEVTFKDMIDGTGKSKAGYNKIRFCGNQARCDELHYFWVDTCCIDKSNSTELAEAINSMFRWYRDAAKCYVYLWDTSIQKRKASDKLQKFSWEAAFRESKWFKRGWTLQELLAPGVVEFFSREGKRLGDKITLEQQLHEITGIAISALRGTPLSEFGVDERLSWRKNRQTTRKEDEAYSLLGIFNIYMSLRYGEGRENAFERLLSKIEKPPKGLNRLECASEAVFNSYAKQHLPLCLLDTRIELLRDIRSWANGKDERCIFWLNGLAGTGKSTIARTVARELFEQKRLGASFFFSRGGGDVGNAQKFVTSIAVQLAESIPTLRRYISGVATEYSDIANRSLHDQWQLLILRPLSKLDNGKCLISYVLVVDALDECDNSDEISIILHLLAGASSFKTVRLQIFLTSRPEVPIRHGFHELPTTQHRDFILHNISPSIVDRDITTFFDHSFRIIQQESTLEPGWPGMEIIKTLVQKSNGLFIWAETACRFIREGLFADERLHVLIRGSTSDTKTPEEHLSKIYITVLQNSAQAIFDDQDRNKFYEMLRDFLGSVAGLLSPLSIKSLSSLLSISKHRLDRILKDLHSILYIPENETDRIRLHHPSFRDFLFHKSRCTSYFYVDEMQMHQALANKCIRLMSNCLMEDICKQTAPGILVSEVESRQIKQCLPQEVQYACLYWIQHLQRSKAQLSDNDQVHQFLQAFFLQWLETLSWIRKYSEGILAISSLQALISASESPCLHAFICDAAQFARYNRSVIEQAPLQIYSSALIFTPKQSIVRKQFEKFVPLWIHTKPNVQARWNTNLQMLEGHTDGVNSVAFSHDSKLLVSASSDSTLKVWNVATGALQQTLDGHTSWISSVAFSHNSKLLASASYGGTIKIWNAVTGTLQQTLEGHTILAYSVVFSHDSKLLASANGNTVKIWNTATGALLQMLESHTKDVNSVAFSHDSKLLASASSDGTVKIWNAATATLQRTLESYAVSVHSVVFSHDSKLLASANDSTVKIWNTATGALQQILDGHTVIVNSVAFSHDSKLLASTSAAIVNTVKVWNTATGALQQTLEGHTDTVKSVAFSHDSKLLASASCDGTIKIWDTTISAPQQTVESHTSWVTSIAFSHNSKLLASGSEDSTIKVWNTATGALQQTLEGHTDTVNSVAFSHNSKLLASASNDSTIKVWDTTIDALQQTLESHTSWVKSIAFSHNSKLLVSASYDNTIKIWNVATGVLQQTLEGHTMPATSVAFSHNSKLLASASASPDGDFTVKVWDVITGALKQTLLGHTSGIHSVAFSHNSKLLASASFDTAVYVWDVATGVPQQTLYGHADTTYLVAFSRDSKLLASASTDDTVKVWDAATGAAQQTVSIPFGISSLSFNKTNTSLVTNIGYIRLDSTELFPKSGSPPPEIGKSKRQRLGSGKSWIIWNDRNLLWLPPDYRSTKSQISPSGSTIAIGYNTGKVITIGFSTADIPF